VVDVGSEFWLGRGYLFTWTCLLRRVYFDLFTSTWQPDFTVSRYGGPPSYSGLLPDNLMTPPRRVGRHHGAEGGGCHDNRRRPCFGEPPPHGGIGEAGINLAVEAPVIAAGAPLADGGPCRADGPGIRPYTLAPVAPPVLIMAGEVDHGMPRLMKSHTVVARHATRASRCCSAYQM